MGTDRRASRAAVHLVVLTVAVVAGLGNVARAADELDTVLSNAGKVWYVARHGGKFPVGEWLQVVADARPDAVHAKVWETIRDDQDAAARGDQPARAVVGTIARYIQSIQTK